MLTFARRILRRTPRAESGSGTGSVLRSYGSAVALNSLNPMLPGLLFGVISIVIGPKPLGAAIVLVLFGMFLGSLAWWVMLSAVVSTLRLRLSFDQMRSINGAAAAGMVAFAALSLTRGLAN
jgi:threonine/homoserine/homoserine lactone efflux protein